MAIYAAGVGTHTGPAHRTRTRVRQIPRLAEIGPFPPPWNGWSTRTYFVCERLEELGCELFLLLPGGEYSPSPKFPWHRVESARALVVWLTRLAIRRYLLHLHINAQNLIYPGIAALSATIAHAFAAPLVLTFHAGLTQQFFPAARARAARWPLRFALGASQLVICNDESVATELSRMGARRVAPIPAFSVQYLAEKGHPIAQLEAVARTAFPLVVTYVEDRWEYHLPSLARCISWFLAREIRGHVVAVGGGAEALGRLVGSVPDRCRLHLVGTVDRDRFTWLLRAAHIYLRSSVTEGKSSSIMEALCHGVWVVANETPHHPPGVLQYPWGNWRAMVEAMSRAIDKARQASSPPRPVVCDTVAAEASLLVETWLRHYGRRSRVHELPIAPRGPCAIYGRHVRPSGPSYPG